MIKANTEYYNLEKVAEVLSVGTAEVNRLREQGKLRGLRDGNTWKFFKEEVHNYLAETIRARSGSGVRQPGESDFDLGDGTTSSSSFDLLMEDAALPDDSDLVSVAPEPSRPASDLDLAALDQDDELSLAEETQISSLVVPKKSTPKESNEASSISSVIPAQVDEDSSALILADAGDIDVLVDEASVLEASGSSPQLGLAGDSGFDVLVAGEDESVLIVAEEKTEVVSAMPDFELVPSQTMLGDDDSESSSQVIAIDAFAGMGQDADPFGQQDNGLGGMDFGFEGGGFDSGIHQASPAAQGNNDPFGTGTPDAFTAAPIATATSTKPATPAEDYSTGTLIALVGALLVMFPAGFMLIDTMLHMWSWSEPFTLNSIMMDTISGVVGL